MQMNYLKKLMDILQSRTAALTGIRYDRAYQTMEEFVLKNGQVYSPQQLPKKFRSGRFQFCFGNSFLAAKRHGLIYVEGYAISNGEHIHAWCVEPGSQDVIDRTWRQGKAYFGVPFDLGFVARTLKSRGCYGVLDNWEQGFPLLETHSDEWKYQGLGGLSSRND